MVRVRSGEERLEGRGTGERAGDLGLGRGAAGGVVGARSAGSGSAGVGLR